MFPTFFFKLNDTPIFFFQCTANLMFQYSLPLIIAINQLKHLCFLLWCFLLCSEGTECTGEAVLLCMCCYGNDYKMRNTSNYKWIPCNPSLDWAGKYIYIVNILHYLLIISKVMWFRSISWTYLNIGILNNIKSKLDLKHKACCKINGLCQ